MFRILVLISTLSIISCTQILNHRNPSSIDNPIQVAVLGDLEGQIKRFNHFIGNSDIFYTKNDEIYMKENKHFVFLGDVMDRGPGTIEIMEKLISLKERYPDKVTIILGNRDINKLKIHQLMLLNKESKIPEIVIPWYKKVLEKKGVKLPRFESNEDFQNFAKKYDNQVMRFQAFLAGMNAPDAFEFRRVELEKKFKRSFTDEEIYFDFKSEIESDGLLKRYLELGELIKIIDGNLYTHGAVTVDNLGYIPGRSRRVRSINEWTIDLNEWASKEIKSWFDDPFSGGKGIIKYHAPQKGKIKNDFSVVYARYSDPEGNPQAPSRKLRKKLRKQGINRVIVGHTPTGDFPILVRKPHFELLLTDSSFRSLESAPIIKIEGREVYTETKTRNGETLVIESNYKDTHNPIGMKDIYGMRVLGSIKDKDQFLLMKVKGKGRKFQTSYTKVNANQVSKRGLTELFEARVEESCLEVLNLFLSKTNS